ncbi:MAG: CinA family nicotinamide mononucleotide deamidase-related protein [Chloroflexi bacterium]|nr:CinA family nicotinamide mononucleotide deamidase-related protein [Chloroflexota bacterium]
MNLEVISIGTELLLGEIVDTNSAYIARQMRDIGVNIFSLTTVGDNRERIAEAIRTSLQRADVVITTGGLGPTVDDMTRQAVADATDRDLEFRPELLEQIAERFRQMGSQMSENNRVQAYIPAGAIPVYNRLGTAPCYIVESEDGIIISLPGVPREMKDILAVSVIPYLREKLGGRGIIKALVLRTAGIGESQIDAQISDMEAWSNPTVGLAAHTGQTDIRITARADTEAEADAMIAQVEGLIRERLGQYIYGVNKEQLEDAFMRALRERGLKLAISYNGPQGELLAQRLREVGATDVIVAELYESELEPLLARLGYAAEAADPAALDYCALAQAEARRVRGETGADVVIAILTREPGTGISTLAGLEERSRCYQYGGVESDAPQWAGTWGMSMAWHLTRRLPER